MNTTRTGMRTVLAAATAGALVMGSAAGAMAAKPEAKPAAKSAVTLQSVSIKGHRTIDVNKDLPAAAITLRATVRDAAKVVKDPASVSISLAIFAKKSAVDSVLGGVATKSTSTSLLMRETSANKKSKYFTATTNVAAIWIPAQLDALRTALKPGDKLYACVDVAEPVGFTVTKYAMKVQKRLGDKSPAAEVQPVKKPVRDCVKVIDSFVDPVLTAPPA